jgi:peptide chain release factor 2
MPFTFYGGIFDWDTCLGKLKDLNTQIENPNLWNDPEAAQKLLKERNALQTELDKHTHLAQSLKDVKEILELAESENDEALLLDSQAALKDLAHQVSRLRLESLLSGEADKNDCYLEIHAGAGGTEAQDWALILLRMYNRWAEGHGYKTELLEESPGEEAGLKSVTLKVTGPNAYGWLKTESGVHRLVRISPFDSAARRHTSFASVWVFPVVDDTIQVDIQEKDLRIDTYRASGAGGQHVNKTESAIRITHMPTGIVVQCQNDRSQHRNRAEAYGMLRARIYEMELQKRETEMATLNASKSQIGWGHQIRSYVLQPYQMVKDLRTGVEKGNTGAVLDGDIDVFLEAALSERGLAKN